MENQHRKITGYRELTQEEIDAMNSIKQKGNELQELISKLENIDGIDTRWLEDGTILLQKGLMSITRAVAKPTSF